MLQVCVLPSKGLCGPQAPAPWHPGTPYNLSWATKAILGKVSEDTKMTCRNVSKGKENCYELVWTTDEYLVALSFQKILKAKALGG